MTLSQRLREIGVVPVIALPDPSLALPLAEALLEGGLRCAEVTFRTSAALEAIEAIRGRYPELMLGAGTVLTIEQADSAIDAGAEFIVAPGTNTAVLDHVVERGVPMLPGVATPTEIETVLARGVTTVKFFPAEQFGGVATIKAFAAPYRGVEYVPTGGISAANLASYLAVPQVAACGGSWMVKKELLEARDFGSVTRLSREAVDVVRSVRLAEATQAATAR